MSESEQRLVVAYCSANIIERRDIPDPEYTRLLEAERIARETGLMLLKERNEQIQRAELAEARIRELEAEIQGILNRLL